MIHFNANFKIYHKKKLKFTKYMMPIKNIIKNENQISCFKIIEWKLIIFK